MTLITHVGSATTSTLLVALASNVSTPWLTATSLINSSPVTVTASGNTVVFQGIVNTTNNAQDQPSLIIDDTAVYYPLCGEPWMFSTVLSAGAHTIDFNMFGLAPDITVIDAVIFLTDLGL